MMNQWYVARGEKQCGPFSPEQLRQFAAAGKIRPTDGIWREGMETAVLAAKVKNLFPAPAVETPLTADVVPSPATAAEFDSLPQHADMQLIPAESRPEPSGGDPEPTAVDDSEIDQPPRGRASPKQRPADPPAEEPRKRQAVSQRGAIILGQDGVLVHYRKKCSTCGLEDNMRSTMRIGQGVTRDHFFCKKCRKNRDVEIRGSVR